MNCDQVFDILTRGPFPTGSSCDAAVEAHLNDCDDCHRLAEALRPAIELFQEAVDPEESRDLPGYWSGVATERPSPVVSYAREIEPRAIAPQFIGEGGASGHYTALAMWRMAAMVAVGITVGTLLSARAFDGFRWPPNNGGAAVAPPSDDDHLRLTETARMELALLPAACFRHKPETSPRYKLQPEILLADAQLENLSCCSGCHNAESDKVPSSATLRVSQSCQYCHTSSPASMRALE